LDDVFWSIRFKVELGQLTAATAEGFERFDHLDCRRYLAGLLK
jgi:hypothetical protein